MLLQQESYLYITFEIFMHIRAPYATWFTVCDRNFITGLTSASSLRVDILSTCKLGQKLGVSLPLLTRSPSAWPSRLLYHRGRKSRRDWWIALYQILIKILEVRPTLFTIAINNFFPPSATAPSGPGAPYYRGFMITLRNTTLGWTLLD
jgi:hypothetical protein